MNMSISFCAFSIACAVLYFLVPLCSYQAFRRGEQELFALLGAVATFIYAMWLVLKFLYVLIDEKRIDK